MRTQELGALVDKRGTEVSRDELRVVEYPLEERDVGGDTAKAELGEPSARTGHCGGEIATTAGHLHEHRVKVGRDLRARADRSTIETDTSTTG